MSDRTAIEWTDSTWNPVTGCTQVSPGCDHCYALRFAERFRGVPGHPFEHGFDLRLRPERLTQPLRWRKPRRVFVNSMSDLFHADVPDEFIAQVFAVMAASPRHTFQVLTKRPQRMRRWLSHPAAQARVWEAARQLGLAVDGASWPLPNVWLGTSIENNNYAWRADFLRRTPAAVRFISAEPLLGPLDRLDLTGIHWLITGGESGPGHRPCDPAWVRDLRDRCVAAGVAFFFKQWGGTRPTSGGRLLDGRTWDEYPVVRLAEAA